MTIHYNDIPEDRRNDAEANAAAAMAEVQATVDGGQEQKRSRMVAGLKKFFGFIVNPGVGGEIADVKGKPIDFMVPFRDTAVATGRVINEAERITRGDAPAQPVDWHASGLPSPQEREMSGADLHDLQQLSAGEVTAGHIDAAIAARQQQPIAEQPPEVPPSAR